MSLTLRGDVGRRLSIPEMDGNFTYLQQLAITGTTSNINTFEVLHSELLSLIETSSLNSGTYYIITDYKTCYDQPDYDLYGNSENIITYKQGSVEPLMVLAIADNKISIDTYQPDYPNDRIKYDYSFTQSEITGGTAYGRITERIDDRNNRTDYDHRTCLFKRYEYFSYDSNEPRVGTVSLSNGILTGEETAFTNFNVGNIIAMPDIQELFFKISSIESDTSMSLTGSVVNELNAVNIKYYSTSSMGFVSYKKTNVSGDSYEEFTTFRTHSNTNNNYIGDHSINFIVNEEDFLLANNVFIGNNYRGNVIGNYSYNNTFNDDCTNNSIGNYFQNNITDNDFDENNIGNYFYSNVISARFRRNVISNYFYNNNIHCNDFSTNRIGSYFYQNKIDGDDGDYDFEFNIISNNFYNNRVHKDFYRNNIGNEFHDNLLPSNGNFADNNIGNYFTDNSIYYSFNNNDIKNECYSNSIYNNFNNNDIGNNFNNNTIGEDANRSNGEFYLNEIKNDVKSNLFLGDNNTNYYDNEFYSNELSDGVYNNIFGSYCFFNTFGAGLSKNNIKTNFYSNSIGTDFNNNNIGSNFNNNNNIGDEFNNNNIGNDFYNNDNIGNYFNNNNIGNSFAENSIGNYFQLNDITAYDISGYNLTNNLHKIVSITYSAYGNSATDGNYAEIIGSTTSSINGINATFNLDVNSGSVTSVSINTAGSLYENNETITILGTQIGGTDVTDDILITITEVYTPSLYGEYNCKIIRTSGDNLRLTYYDQDDILTIKEIDL